MKTITVKTLGVTLAMVSGVASAADNLVLVHGAHFAADSWRVMTPHLSPNTKVLAVNLPGRDNETNAEHLTLTDYAKALCLSLSKLSGDVHIAAHSQGGAVVHRALGLCPEVNIASITYITSVAPLQGETAFELLNKQDYTNYEKSITFNESSHRMEIQDKGIFADYFAQDATPAARQILTSAALSEPAHIGDEVMALPKEKLASVNKYYVFANQDKIISLDSQLKIAEQIDLQSVYSLDTGHSPMLTQPKQLAEILNQIVAQQ